MTVKVRLARAGTRHTPFFRIVVADERCPRDGAFLELVGTYDPAKKPEVVRMKKDRIDYWMSKGARPTQTVAELLRRHGKQA